ncbi:histidinol-phosphate transaminase [Parvularcula lutaonensis]|uniref:Histidinol-phosphate aminotransferase n=1 Tax=Parvularcula lutaonensis TaxID=491923 RepID=A0ABV7M9Q6_9PROT|nr:histidinol-phosphate transaminase [Parvularcula lutaonensis]GGY45111.1 histidinol-phosphate aminotransferase [Parvularcula lutaonensis]
MTRPTPRPGILDISPYVPGKAKAGAGKVHKLSSNESALGPAPSAIKAAEKAAGKLHLYPDGSATALREKLGQVYDLNPDHLVCGNGSDELLSLSVRCFTEPGDEVLMTKHGFSYYPLCAMAEGCTPVQAEEDDLVADVDALLAAVTEKTKVLFLANPNNPTGTLLPNEEIGRLRENLREDILLVLDGAYAEYLLDTDYDPGTGFVREAIATGADNVVMTRTFSKIYGLGGMRVGWAYAPPSVIDVFNRVRSPFNVTAPGLVAGEAALDDQDFVERNRRHNFSEMARLVQALRGHGLTVRETMANFILVELPDTAEAQHFLQHQENHGVLVRGLSSSNLPNFVRVSIGSREANDAFLAASESFSR